MLERKNAAMKRRFTEEPCPGHFRDAYRFLISVNLNSSKIMLLCQPKISKKLNYFIFINKACL
jgi:hypothetical protein